MDKKTAPEDLPVIPPVPLSPDESLNRGYTAIPHDTASGEEDTALEVTSDTWGTMNEEEARESGYIGEDGLAVDHAKRATPTSAEDDRDTGRTKRSEREPFDQRH